MNLSERVGNLIRKFRMERGITQEELAYRTGLHQSQIYRLENGKRRFNSDQLEKISQALDVPIIKFFEEEKEAIDEFDDQELLKIVSRIGSGKRGELVEILQNLVEDIDFEILKKFIEIVKLIKES